MDDAPAWWDEAFSRLLFELVPLGAQTLIDVRCGLAHAAEVLLPARDRLAYLGLDDDRELLGRAAERLSNQPFTPRVTLRVARGERLAIPDATADVVLLLMALGGREAEPGVMLDEARRVLVPGGRLIALEADNLATRFSFAPLDGSGDASLAALNAAFAAALGLAPEPVRALAPRLPSLLERAGLAVEARVHALSVARRETAADFAARVRALAPEPESPALKAALAPLEADARVGWSLHHSPAVVAVGTRPDAL